MVVREEHGEAVDAHAEAAGGRQAVLEGAAEGLVDALCLVVALRLLSRLLVKPQPLLARDVQLRVTAVRPCVSLWGSSNAECTGLVREGRDSVR